MLRMVNSRSLALCLLLFSLASQSAADIIGRIQVVDGDTIRVSGQVIRLFGVDAPEAKQTCQTSEGLHWSCGAWVSDVLRNAFDGQEARCVEVEQDRYGRSVARCEVAGVDLGRWLVQRGLAFAYRKYSMDYDLDEKRAAINDRGLHASRVQNPAGFRAAGVQRADAACGCPEPPPGGKVFVDLEEYLQGYLTRRFGLQGHMSAWEVEQLGKDFGWVMGAQVALREGP